MILIAETQEEIESKLQEQKRNQDPEYLKYLSRQLPNLIGTADMITERIAEYVSHDVDHFILRWPYGYELESIKLFKEKVMKKI